MFTRLNYGPDGNQFGELYLPVGEGPHPCVIFIHGGYWRERYDLTHAREFCGAVARAGIAVWSLEYRRIGQPGGGYPGTCADILAGARHVSQLPGIDPGRIKACGHSAGGHLALWLAAQNAIALQSVIALAAITDLQRGSELNLSNGAVEEFMGGAAPELASPMHLLPILTPQILIHGTGDDTVPFELSETFAARSPNATLIPLPGAGHFEPIDPHSDEWPVVLEQLRFSKSDSELSKNCNL